jgi:hypothetical protein
MNDYAARLRAEGVNNAYNMAQGFYGNMLQANPQYQAAYNLGQPYSDVEQYNDMVDQVNSNAWAGWVGDAGKVIGSIPTPWTMAIGAAMQGVGNAFTVDDSALRSMQGTANNYGLYQNMLNSQGQQAAMNDLFAGLENSYNKGKLNWLLPKSREVDYNPLGLRY